jgi:hypothetical protein
LIVPSTNPRRLEFRNHELEVLRDLRHAGAHLGQTAGARDTRATRLSQCMFPHLRPSSKTPFKVSRCTKCSRWWGAHEILDIARVRILHLQPALECAEKVFSSPGWERYQPLWDRLTSTTVIFRPHHPNIFAFHKIMMGRSRHAR